VDLVKGKPSQRQHLVLYFFCSTAPGEASIAITFVSTIIHQLASHSPQLKERVTTVFLRTLLDTILRAEPLSDPERPRFKAGDSDEATVKKILKASSSGYWSALRAVMDIEREQELSLIIDGLDKTEHQDDEFTRGVWIFIEYLRERYSTVRVLLTSRPHSKIRDMLNGLPCIEYDKERKGLICLISYSSNKRRKLRIAECLNTLRFDNTRYEKISDEFKGSLEWLWTHGEYLDWSATDSSSLLLIEGKPGSGKSTLMKYFQRSLLERDPYGRQIVASFYYSYREGKQQTNHSNMLRSLLYDILNQNEAFFFHFQSHYRERGRLQWSYGSLKKVLLSLMKHHPVEERIHLILDAMDESVYGDRNDVIELLHGVCAIKGPCVVKVFVASRPIVGLNRYSAENQKMIRLEDVNSSDILKFAESFLSGGSFPADIVSRAKDYIVRNAEGVFVWVHLVREELVSYARSGYTEDQIFSFLEGLPTELEGFYKLTLTKLEGGKKEEIKDGLRMLQFVMFAYRPLRLEELRQALAIPENTNTTFSCSSESFKRNLIHSIDKRVISCTGNFLEIKKVHGSAFSRSILLNGLANKSAEDSVVQVMHQTVREFFRSDGPTAQSMFRMNSYEVHLRISNICVRYLMLCAADTTSIDQAVGSKSWTSEHFEAYAQYLSGRPFFNYALVYVKQHLQQCGQVAGASELISQLYKKLNESPAAYVVENWIPRAWGQRIPAGEQQGYGKRFRAELLHAATRMRYSQVVEALLIAGAEVEACIDGSTPLMVTAKSGDLATARILLDGGALIGARDGNKQEALHLAAANGNNPVVGLLIDRGAEKEAKDDKRQTALHLAAANGHNPVVGLLIDRGAEKEAKDDKRQTALHLAAANGHNPVIKLLVDKGANKKAKDVLGWEALHTAAWNDHEATIQMLIRSFGANTEERDKCGWTALHVAAMNGCDGASRWLIEHLGADKEAKDDLGWTALHFVAALGLEDTAQLLIETLDVGRGVRNKEGKTARDLAQGGWVLWALGLGTP
jgi:ankyrin repeat protein